MDLLQVKNLKVTGGYGGLNENDLSGQKNEKNSMTLYVEDEDGNDFNIRIDDSALIKDTKGGRIKSYKYFVDYCNQGEGYTFDFTGLMGIYESQTTDKSELQLMLVSTVDLVYNTPEVK